MSYHGLIPLVKQHIYQLPAGYAPSLLEVGVDRGVTFLTLSTFMARTRASFLALGIDVLVQEQVAIQLHHLDMKAPEQAAFCVQGNSLEVLPKLIEQGLKFDVVLIDGDHNYYTVSSELQHLEALVGPTSIVVIDDYEGRWAERDLWYAERAGYEGVKDATRPVETEKHGVKAAVDEWLAAHPEWAKSQPVPGEPVMLMKQVA
jgi:predicted O-methyltransferase YrrM